MSDAKRKAAITGFSIALIGAVLSLTTSFRSAARYNDLVHNPTAELAEIKTNTIEICGQDDTCATEIAALVYKDKKTNYEFMTYGMGAIGICLAGMAGRFGGRLRNKSAPQP